MKTGLPKGHLSYTQLSMFERCAREYYTNYHEGKKKETIFMQFGKMIHEVLAEINESLMKDKENFHSEDARKIFDKVAAGYKLKFDLIQKGWEMVEKYALNAFASKSNILRAEYEIKTVIHTEPELSDIMECITTVVGKPKTLEPDIEVLGYIDRIDVSENGLEIIDFKTGELVPSKEEVRSNLQLNIYAYMVSKLFPELVGEGVKISYYHVPTGIKIPYMIDKVGLDRLIDIENYIIELFNRLTIETEWKPTRNEYCFYCLGKQECPEYKAQIEESYNPKVYDNIEDLAAEFVKIKVKESSLSKELTTLKGLIKDYMQANMTTSLITSSGILNLLTKHKEPYKVEASDYTELRLEKLLKKEKKSVDK